MPAGYHHLTPRRSGAHPSRRWWWQPRLPGRSTAVGGLPAAPRHCGPSADTGSRDTTRIWPRLGGLGRRALGGGLRRHAAALSGVPRSAGGPEPLPSGEPARLQRALRRSHGPSRIRPRRREARRLRGDPDHGQAASRPGTRRSTTRRWPACDARCWSRMARAVCCRRLPRSRSRSLGSFATAAPRAGGLRTVPGRPRGHELASVTRIRAAVDVPPLRPVGGRAATRGGGRATGAALRRSSRWASHPDGFDPVWSPLSPSSRGVQGGCPARPLLRRWAGLGLPPPASRAHAGGRSTASSPLPCGAPSATPPTCGSTTSWVSNACT